MPILEMTVPKLDSAWAYRDTNPHSGFPVRRIPENALRVNILIRVKRFGSGSLLRAHPKEYAQMNHC